MNFTRVLDSVVDQIPATGRDRTAVVFDGRERITYEQLLDSSRRYASALRELGLGKGDRLGLMLYNDAEYLPLCFAAMRLGVIAVRLNFRLAPAELRFILNDSGCKAVVIHSSLLAKVEPVRAELSVETFVVRTDSERETPEWAHPFDVLGGHAPLGDAPEVAAGDPMSLLYTSGTTGLPKGAVWTHANTVAAATAQALRWRFSPQTVALVPGPLYHAGAVEAVTAPALLMHGRVVTLASGNFTVDHLLELIEREQVTDCLLFSFMLNEMLHLGDLERRLPESLRHFIIGGDTMMPWMVAEVRRRLPGIRLTQVYGLTEGGAIATTLDDEDFDSQPDSIGRPLPLAEVKVWNGDGDIAAGEAAVGEVGEIVVRSGAVCAGYWNRPAANRDTFVDGWCRTGDLGYVNADGFLILAGRAKDMIRSGGENVYPAEIEAVLTAHPQIQDAAVIAVPDPKYTEVGCAVLVAEAGVHLDEAALRAYCRERLASYKVPKYFVEQDELPRNASGKILKYTLRARYENAGATADSQQENTTPQTGRGVAEAGVVGGAGGDVVPAHDDSEAVR
ncbi:acyl-CoA synthetase (AMP-forming)/AMP-acid ligase II [Nocardia kruczakiae]|uniref:Acyl-CoA synthetase (AMP-forming)/AMP-acid ligase II n=1 Tax=Nocardia kruczakiae TaxID=261477 RepID=A0ABU1X8S1_9NOCA|nr:AMP-binding protein [Nocardia kruczakiae]MDR7166943.1 acyl-CoA synthetase (AMP-forming)/AMP-acid ligase II [Nocardia kruczakiae]